MSCTYQQKTKLLWAGTPASRCHPWDLNRPCLHAGEQQLCSWQQKRLPASACPPCSALLGAHIRASCWPYQYAMLHELCTWQQSWGLSSAGMPSLQEHTGVSGPWCSHQQGDVACPELAERSAAWLLPTAAQPDNTSRLLQDAGCV